MLLPHPISVSVRTLTTGWARMLLCSVRVREEGSYPASTTSWLCVSGQAPLVLGDTPVSEINSVSLQS